MALPPGDALPPRDALHRSFYWHDHYPPLLFLLWREETNLREIRTFLQRFIPHPVLFRMPEEGRHVFVNVVTGAELVKKTQVVIARYFI